MNKRLASLDFFRGIALLSIIFFHTAVYSYANINKIDFSNPPILIVVISFLVLWGGLLILYSGFVNTVMLSERIKENNHASVFRYLFIASGIYVLIHYILNIFLGRWATDFVHNRPDMSVVAASLRNAHFTFPTINKFFEGSSIATIAFNLLCISVLLFFLFNNNGIKKQTRNYFVLLSLGFILMLFSFIRIPLYQYFTFAIESKNYFMATILSFIVANPYPLIPYLAYGLFAAAIGMMYSNKRTDLLKKIMVPTGLFFLLYGLLGCLHFKKTISTPDYFWYFKTHLELGIFILLLLVLLLFLEKRPCTGKNLVFIRWFSQVSLTVYLLETFVSELLRIILSAFVPLWNQTINGCLIFGAINVFIWIAILFFWQKNNFKYSVEYFWVLAFTKMGKKSSKLDKSL